MPALRPDDPDAGLEPEPPDWWRAWKTLANLYQRPGVPPAQIDVAIGSLLTQGVPVESLRGWRPDKKGRIWLRALSRVMAVLLTGSMPPDRRHTTEEALVALLNDAESSEPLRTLGYLATTYLAARNARVEADRLAVFARAMRQIAGGSAATEPGGSLRLDLTAPAAGDVGGRYFGKGCNSLSVYLDESWPGHDEPRCRGIGVIAGVVWQGKDPDADALRPIAQHLRDDRSRKEALAALTACPRAFPFIMPIAVPDGEAHRHYEQMVAATLFLLLGWVLPVDGVPASVNILIERKGDHSEGRDATGLLAGWLAAGAPSPRRFERWHVGSVRWGAKDDGYLAYADLLAYLALPVLAPSTFLHASLGVDRLPGYIPFHTSLLPALLATGRYEESLDAGAVLDLFARTEHPNTERLVRADIKERLRSRTDLQERLLDELRVRSRAKDRVLANLRRQLNAVDDVADDLDVRNTPGLRLLWTATALQHANSHGNPAMAEAYTRQFLQLRAKDAEHDRELAAEVELNLAVHHADRFEFSQGQRLIEDTLAAPGAVYLAPATRGRLWSSLGQFRSISGRHAEAEECFAKAIALFERADLTAPQRGGEIDQTSVYRVINRFDGRLPEADVLQWLLICKAGETPVDAARRLATTRDRAYHHHLLLRTAPGASAATWLDAYLDEMPRWSTGDQHPWELINLYRGLMLWRGRRDDTGRHWLDRAIAEAVRPEHGATLTLIAAAIAVVVLCLDTSASKPRAEALVAESARALPGAAGAVETLQHVLSSPSPDRVLQALAVLPFNYR